MESHGISEICFSLKNDSSNYKKRYGMGCCIKDFKIVYWISIDSHKIFYFNSLGEMVGAEVISNNSVKDLWGFVEIINIDGNEKKNYNPDEMSLNYYELQIHMGKHY